MYVTPLLFSPSRTNTLFAAPIATAINGAAMIASRASVAIAASARVIAMKPNTEADGRARQ